MLWCCSPTSRKDACILVTEASRGLREGLDQDFFPASIRLFKKAAIEMGFSLGAPDMRLVEKWLEFYSQWPGRRVIGFSDPGALAVKLLADSYAPRLWGASSEDAPVIDLGSGNGWPGLAFSSLGRVSLLDSRQGACDFMKAFVQYAALDNVNVIEGRAEEIGLEQDYRGRFGIATSRAMASPAVAVEMASPFVRPGGAAMLWLGPAQEDGVAGHSTIPELGLTLESRHRYDLMDNMGRRLLAVYRRTGSSQPGFPRKMASIKARPLF